MDSSLLTKDNFYHIYNRGNVKQVLFKDRNDYVRFLFLLLHLQSPASVNQIGRYTKRYLNTDSFNVSEEIVTEILENRFVKVLNFCLMPNHFHLTVKSVEDNGVSKYMQKLGNAYAKYFNLKYDVTGYVFEGSYKAKVVTDDEQLAYLSAYIHRNPKEIKKWQGKNSEYCWSSYQDYENNRWGELLVPDDIMDTFSSFEDYSCFVENSGAKEDWENS